MFILTKISDLVQIEPHDFYKLSLEAIEDNINEKYANKIIQNVGLGICFYDLLDCSEGLIGHGNGLVNVNVEFRMVVFRPFKGEIILGKITHASEMGMRLSLEFFRDIMVPPSLLLEGAYYDEEEKVWIWKNEDEENFYFDKGEIVRFRVEDEQWHDQSPTGPVKLITEEADGKTMILPTETTRKAPYTIVASMQMPGLGPVSWW